MIVYGHVPAGSARGVLPLQAGLIRGKCVACALGKPQITIVRYKNILLAPFDDRGPSGSEG
jgi:hypothetical protein